MAASRAARLALVLLLWASSLLGEVALGMRADTEVHDARDLAVVAPRWGERTRGKAAMTTLTLANLDHRGVKCSLIWAQATTVRGGEDIHRSSTSTARLQLRGDCKSTPFAFRLQRQGKTMAHLPWESANSSKPGKLHTIFTFTKMHLNRRFTFEATDHSSQAVTLAKVVHLYVPSGPRCESSDFTHPSLQCSPFPHTMIPQDSQSLIKKLQLSNMMAYAVEFEGVLRRPPKEMLPRRAEGRWAAFDQKSKGKVKGLVEKYFSHGTWPESVAKLVQNGERGHYQKVSEAFFFPALQSCFNKVTSSSVSQGKTCISPRTCGLSGFCSTQKNRHRLRGPPGTCKDRDFCKEDAASVACPKPFKQWPWMFDSSVMPMDENDTADVTEWDGVPVEIVAPGPKPPNQWPLRGGAGLRNIGEMLASLKWMGVQMGPSTGMHVHVNIKSVAAGGDCCLHDKQVARIWMAFAKYQLVIDEMMTSARVTNAYAVGLLLGDARIASIFANIHDFFNGIYHHVKADGSPDFCNSALGVKRDPLTLKKIGLEGAWGNEGKKGKKVDGKICHIKGMDERYTALNLHALGKHGTIEFRQHAGTHDIERVLRWVQFVVAFVHAYRNSLSMDRYFDDEVVTDWEDLFEDQLRATPERLFASLTRYGTIDPASKAYFMKHQWAPTCPMVPAPLLVQVTVGQGFTPSPLVSRLKRSAEDLPMLEEEEEAGSVAVATETRSRRVSTAAGAVEGAAAQARAGLALLPAAATFTGFRLRARARAGVEAAAADPAAPGGTQSQSPSRFGFRQKARWLAEGAAAAAAPGGAADWEAASERG